MYRNRILISALLLLSTFVANAYDRGEIARMLQEQSYAELLAMAEAISPLEQDAYLLTSAGFAAYQTNGINKAEAYFSRALEKDTQSIQSLLYLGLINQKRKNYLAAIPYFKQLAALRPDNGRYYKYLADCYSTTNKADSTFMFLSLAYQHAPGDPSIITGYADVLLDKSAYKTVDSLLNKYLAIDSSNVLVIEVLIKSKYQQRKFKEVIAAAEILFAAKEVSYVPYYYAIGASYQLKNYEKCISIALTLLEAGYQTEQVYYYIAQAYAGQKDYEASNKFLRKCLKMAISDEAETYYTLLGENSLAQKKYSLAQRNYDTASYLSGNPVLLYRKALAYDECKQSGKAKNAYAGFLKAARKEDSSMIKYAQSRVSGNQ